MLTDREKALVDMIKSLAEELRDLRETGCIDKDIYESTAYTIATQTSEASVDEAIDYHLSILNKYK